MSVLEKNRAPALQAERPLAPRETLFRQEVVAFQQASRQWGRVVPLQPLSTRIMVWFVTLTAAAVITFLFFAQYARKESALGYLAPMSGSARVYAPAAGVISVVHVHQGDLVTAGQPLLTVLTSQIAGSNQDINEALLTTLQQQKAALTRRIADEVHRSDTERQRLTAQVQEHETVLTELQAEMQTQQERVMLNEKSVEAGLALRPRGLVSDVDQRHREDVLLEQRQQLLTLRQQFTTRQGQLSEVKYNLEQLPLNLNERVQSLRNELASTEQKIADVTGRSSYVVRAPVSGKVSLLQADVGQVVDPKKLELQIIPPHAHLEAKLFIPVRAIGFVEPGQDVRLQYDAFPYQRFGTYHGKIKTVSQTVLLPSDTDGQIPLHEPAYAATVTLDRPDIDANGKTVPLQPDMSLKAEIILEKRTLMQWILSPLRHMGVAG